MLFIGLRGQWLASLLIILSICQGCRHVKKTSFGLQTDNLAFIPARIAVLPCQTWPKAASYPNMPLTNVDSAVTTKICEEFDQFVIHGFSNQPYMRGLSPKVVKSLLTKNDQLAQLDQMEQHWRRAGNDCMACTDAVTYYQEAIAERESWRLWLTSFSRAAYHSDALLLPFIIYAHEGRRDDRGLIVAYRQVGIALLLIDTNNGQLIWAGGRTAEGRRQEPRAKTGPEIPAYPPWEEVMNRLFVNEIWQEFPGRQNF